MRKNFWAGFIMVLLLVLSGCGPRVVDGQQVAKDERIVIKFSHVVAENTPKGLAAQRFADLVRERTGGYVEIQVFPDSELYKDGEEFDALNNGAVQLLAPATSKISVLFPDWQVLDLPYAFADLSQVHAFMAGAKGQTLFNELKQKGMLGLGMWDNGFKQMTNNQHPLIQPQDFRGLRFRVMPANVLQQQFNVLGATAVPLAFSDVHEALKNGNVDGEENTISNIYTQRFDQVQKYLTISNHGYIGYVVLTNQKFWDSLPPNIRKILDDTLAEVTIWEQKKAEEVNQEQLEALKKEGKIQIHQLTEAEVERWNEALAHVYGRLAEDIGADLVDRVNHR